MVEEANAAARSLVEEANRLLAEVLRFRNGNEPRQHSPNRSAPTVHNLREQAAQIGRELGEVASLLALNIAPFGPK